MLARVMTCVVFAAAVAVLASAARAAITIDMVRVGNTGNIADTAANTGDYAARGAVNYAYNIGKYEVTAGQYTAFLSAVAGVDTYGLYNTSMSNTSNGSGIARTGGGTVGNPYAYTVDPVFTNRPANYVSWGDAARFCNWIANGQPTGAQGPATTEDGSYYLNGALTESALGGVMRKTGATWFIPTEDEWYKAAYHKNDGNTANYFTYPTSNNTAPGQNMADPFGNNANYYTAPYTLPIDSGKYTTLVGEFQNSASPYGTFDQGGNVWEWNEALFPSSSRGMSGGSYNNYLGFALAARAREVTDATHEENFIGFRVASVPEPGCIALLLAGAVVLQGFAWRRRKRPA